MFPVTVVAHDIHGHDIVAGINVSDNNFKCKNMMNIGKAYIQEQLTSENHFQRHKKY